MRGENIQHGQSRRLPVSKVIPLVIIVIEIAALIGVVIWGLHLI